jgi:hypothetical protein
VLRPGRLAPLLDERADLWSRWDRAVRLVDGLVRRAAAVIPVPENPSASTVPHPRLTSSEDLVEELVAIDAAVVASVLALQTAQLRLQAAARARTRRGGGARVLARSAAALVVVALTVVLVGAIR